MLLSIRNINNIYKGLGTGKVSNLSTIKTLSEKHLNNIYNKLSENITPGLIQEQGSDVLYKKANAFLDTLTYPFAKMPKEILNNIAEKFNIKSLYNSKMLTEFRNKNEQEQINRAIRGLLEHSETFIKKAEITKNTKKPTNPIDDFYKLIDENLAPNKAKYNTTHERVITRVISGFTAAAILGNDFYNKSIKNGKTDEEATKEAKSKRNQEIIENAQEAVSQYFMLGAFSGFTNNSTYAAPILNTVLGTVFRVTSRLSTGRPLTRIKPPENSLADRNLLSFEGFMEAAKAGKSIQFKGNEPQAKKEDKKHILTFKNIALACFTSIAAGFAIRGFKGTKTFKKLENFAPVKSIRDKFKKATTSELWMNEKEQNDFFDVLNSIGLPHVEKFFNEKYAKYSNEGLLVISNKGDLIGEYEKFIKIPFTKIQISKKELLLAPLTPFRIVKEIASFPYKLVSAALEGLGVIKKTKPAELKNDYNLVNTILDFKKQAAKFDNNIKSKEFLAHYKNHMKKTWETALNKETKSNVNNCDIGKLTALLGTFSSIYFSTTDDYNSTLKQTGDVEKANKDARLRGINKIIRTSVQCAFLNLNHLFKILYSQSLIGAGAVTAACTVLTDSVSRVLSGMPFKKMNKEELEQYNKEKQNTVLKGYYTMLDKLTE